MFLGVFKNAFKREKNIHLGSKGERHTMSGLKFTAHSEKDACKQTDSRSARQEHLIWTGSSSAKPFSEVTQDKKYNSLKL